MKKKYLFFLFLFTFSHPFQAFSLGFNEYFLDAFQNFVKSAAGENFFQIDNYFFIEEEYNILLKDFQKINKEKTITDEIQQKVYHDFVDQSFLMTYAYKKDFLNISNLSFTEINYLKKQFLYAYLLFLTEKQKISFIISEKEIKTYVVKNKENFENLKIPNKFWDKIAEEELKKQILEDFKASLIKTLAKEYNLKEDEEYIYINQNIFSKKKLNLEFEDYMQNHNNFQNINPDILKKEYTKKYIEEILLFEKFKQSNLLDCTYYIPLKVKSKSLITNILLLNLARKEKVSFTPSKKEIEDYEKENKISLDKLNLSTTEIYNIIYSTLSEKKLKDFENNFIKELKDFYPFSNISAKKISSADEEIE